MSASKTVNLYCDSNEDECQRHGDQFGDYEYRTAEEVRARAKSCGWIVRGGKDYCPDCAEKFKKRPTP